MDELAKVRESYEHLEQALVGIRADKRLNDHGKRIFAARAWLTAATAATEASSRREHSRTLRRRDLEQRLLGPGPVPIGATASDRIARDSSFRDAIARCAETDPERPHELQQLLARASLTGDGLMERAAAVVAYERKDADTMNAFLSVHPELDADFTELWSSATLRDDLGLAMQLAPPMPPAELDGLDESGIRAVAELHPDAAPALVLDTALLRA